MRTETRYVCDICGSKYVESENAKQCEARGVPTPPPIGLLEAGEPGDFYDDKLAFAVASATVSGHSVRVSMWACRDTGYGDSLGDDLCGSPNDYLRPVEYKPEWLVRPPMIRLIQWMRDNGHEPLVFANHRIAFLREVESETESYAQLTAAEGGPA